MSTMELHAWHSRTSWPMHVYLGTISWNLRKWALESPPVPASEDRAEHLFVILDALERLDPPAERTDEAVCRALKLKTKSAVFRTAKNLTLKYGPVLDVRLRYTCPSCIRGGRLRRNSPNPLYKGVARDAWNVQRSQDHPDIHSGYWECRHCTMPWVVSGTAPLEHVPLEPKWKSSTWWVREARLLCEVVQQQLTELASMPSERARMRALFRLPHFEAIILGGGLKPLIARNRALKEFLTPEMTALCERVSHAQATGVIDLERIADDAQRLEQALDRFCGVDNA